MKDFVEFVIQEIGLCWRRKVAVPETVLCSATKDPKHVLQGESLFDLIFFKASNLFRCGSFLEAVL